MIFLHYVPQMISNLAMLTLWCLLLVYKIPWKQCFQNLILQTKMNLSFLLQALYFVLFLFFCSGQDNSKLFS